VALRVKAFQAPVATAPGALPSRVCPNPRLLQHPPYLPAPAVFGRELQDASAVGRDNQHSHTLAGAPFSGSSTSLAANASKHHRQPESPPHIIQAHTRSADEK